MPDLAGASATRLRTLLQAGRTTAREVMEAHLDRVAAEEPRVRAFAYLDGAAALRRAEAAGQGKLHGLPVGIKDVLDTHDMPSEYGSTIWAGHRPRADAASVAWTRAAGGVPMGKTVTTEFATRQPGPTTNPHDPLRTPGGSSSGSAAGVAAGFFPLAFGTQTAGSIIRPAAFCGVVGYKPSHGMISRVGHKLMSDTLDTLGTFGRTVADCALLAGAVSGWELGDPDSRLGRAPRLGIARGPGWDRVAPETEALLPRVETQLARAGAQVRAVELPAVFADAEMVHALVMHAESARALGWEMTTSRTQLSEALRERMEWGLDQPPHAVGSARLRMAEQRAAFATCLDGIDAIVTPAAPGFAPEGIGWTGDPCCNFLWTGLHVPCISVPAGSGPGSMPLGVQIVGRSDDDAACLAVAAWVAAALQ